MIPDELIRKIQDQNTFNQGFMTTELLAAALLDMELHNLTDTASLDVVAFEKAVMDKLGLIPEIAPRYRATYFNHILSGYAAGYYSYLWAEVLDADAFEAFKEHGLFDKNTADFSAGMFWKRVGQRILWCFTRRFAVPNRAWNRCLKTEG